MGLKTDRIAEIIVKHLQGKCTDEENSVLSRWSKTDPRNEALLAKVLESQNVEQGLRILNRFNEERAWRRVGTRIARPYSVRSVSRYGKWAMLAASVLLVLGFGVWLYEGLFLNSKDDTPPRVVASVNPKYKNDILPAIEGATLVMADGEEIALSGDVTIQDNGNVLNENNDKVAVLSGAQEVVYNELIVPQTHFFSFRLPDGTKVWVNANSKLKFPSRFVGDKRHVYLTEGEAYFEVTRNEGQPFVVETSKATIKVLGTKFNVRNYQEEFVTTLAEGKVQVSDDDGTHDLMPKQKAVIRGDKLAVRGADLTKDLAWKNNIFYFRNDNLKNIMQQIENWYGVQVVVARSLINNNTYSGEIGRDAPLSEILNMLEFTSGLDFSLEGTKLYIKQKNNK